MTATEIKEGLSRLGVLHETALPYTPVQSSQRWLTRPENHGYICGPVNVAGVRRWRSGNPYYWRRAQHRRGE